MHEVDQTTEQMVRSVLAYAENRLRMNPVPLDKGVLPADELYERLDGVIRDTPRPPDEVLGVYTSVIAPSVISADSPRFLGFIPAAPTKASLLFDMLVSCASIQGISWLEASGAIAAENSVLRVIAHEAGLPTTSGGCFVSGGSAGNLSALAVARETAKNRGATGRLRVVVGSDAHSSIVNTLRLLEMDALVVDTPDHRLTADTVRDVVPPTMPRTSPPWSARRARRTPASSTTWPVSARSPRNVAGGSTSTAPTAARASSPARCGRSTRASSRPTRSSSTRTSGCSPRSTAAHCCTESPSWRGPPTPRTRRTSTSSTPREGEWNPSDYAYHLTRRARGLPLWFSLAVYGLEAYRQAIEVARALAVQTAELIKAAPQLELIREPDLGVVLFRRLGWKPEDYDAWAQRLHQDQVAFIPPTKWEGETVGRFAFLHPDTTLELVREVLARTE